MPAEVKSLGKAYCKVELYNRLVGLNYERTKLRQPYSFTLGTQSSQHFKRDCWGIQFLTVPRDDAQEHQSACIIPEPCYEPIDNFMKNTGTASATSSGRAVYWTQLGASQIDDLLIELVSKHDPNDTMHAHTNLGADTQSWTQENRLVQSKIYRESEYIAAGISYPTGTEAPVAEAIGAGYSGAAATPASVNFVFEKQGGLDTWWGISSSQFFMPGGAFWVSMIPNTTYISDSTGKTKDAYLAIRIAKHKGCPILFSISNTGKAMVSYAWQKTEATATAAATYYKTKQVAVNLPEISEAFKNGNEIRLGFLIACGRLFIYLKKDRYESVPITPSTPDAFPYIEHLNLGSWDAAMSSGVGEIAVYGYGCQAYINACEMTFCKRAWFILKDMDGNMLYKGHKSPTADTYLGGTKITAGTYAPGLLINWNISREQFKNSATTTSSNNSNAELIGCPMYAGQFEYYRERDMVVSPNVDTIKVASVHKPQNLSGSTTTNTYPAAGVYTNGECFYYTKANGARNWWGRIDIVRHAGFDGLYSTSTTTSTGTTTSSNTNKIWFCYLQTYDWVDGDGQVHANVRYPIVYNISGCVPMAAVPTYTAVQQSARNISDNVISVDITSALDNHKPTMIQKKATVTVYDDNNFDDYLLRARGIKIWLKWSIEDDPTFNDIDIAFTGVAFGERSVVQPGKSVVVFTCVDYWGIMDRVQIKNGPFYDGFEIYSVLKDLGERVGINVVNDVDHSGNTGYVPNTKNLTVGVPFYFLGSGFSFDAPAFRFQSSDTISKCMAEAIRSFPYYMWFGTDGSLNVSVVPGNFDFSCVNSKLFHKGWDYSIKGWYYRSINNITSTNPHKLILNEIQMTSTLKDGVFNSFMVRGVERSNNTPVTITDGRKESLNDPNAIGYLGFVADTTISQPALDSEAAARLFMDRYKRMWSQPGFETTITTIGHIPTYKYDNGVTIETRQTRPGHFIQISQNITPSDKRFRLTEINHKYDAERNEWYTTLGAYQIHAPDWNMSSSSSCSTAGP